MARKKTRNKKKKRQVNKQLAQSITQEYFSQTGQPGRGYTVTTLSRLMQINGRDKNQKIVSTTSDYPSWYLLPSERERIMKLCTPVLGVITSRMNRLASAEFEIVPEKKQEDRIYENMRSLFQMFSEFAKSNDLNQRITRAKIQQMLRGKLPDLLPDLSNFNQSIIRWRKNINFKHADKADAIKEWLESPNRNDSWSDFIKKWVKDYLLHGSAPVYKEWNGGRIDNFNMLPGGSVIPFRTEFVSQQSIFIQVISGREPQIFYPDEMSYSQYLPNAYESYGIIPLEALINKITETLLFDDLMAKQADGSKYPEKMVIIADNSPFGDPDADLKMPIDAGEQDRVEGKVNTRIKGGVMTFTGNAVSVVDLTRENTMVIQTARQKDIREDVALVFNMSDQEVNLMGSKKFSSNDTANQQADIELSKGINPIKLQIQNMINRDILPFAFGGGYIFEFEKMRNEMEEVQLEQTKINTGTYSVNELRIERNEMPFEGEQYNRPPGAEQLQPDGSENKPLNVKEIKR